MAASLKKNFIVLLLSRGLVLALALANALLLARYLGPHDFGVYSYAVGLTTIVFGWADLGLSSYAARQFQLQPTRRRSLLHGFATITYRMGLLLSLGVIVGALWFGKDRVVSCALMVACVWQFFRGLTVPWRALLTSEERIPEIGFQEFSVRLGTTVLLVVMAATRQNVLGMLWATALPVAAGYWWLRRRTRGLAGEDSEPVGLMALLHEAWPFSLHAILYAVYFQIDIVLLEKLQPLTAVGYYGAATRFIYPLLQVPAALMLSAFPKLVAASQAGTTGDGPRLRAKLLRTLLGTACLAAVPLAILSPWIVPMLLGPKYTAAVVTLQIMTLYVPLAFGQALASHVLMASGRGRELAVIYGIGLIANVGLNLWLIPRYAHNGCAIATVSAEAIVVAVSVFFLRSRSQTPPDQERV